MICPYCTTSYPEGDCPRCFPPRELVFNHQFPDDIEIGPPDSRPRFFAAATPTEGEPFTITVQRNSAIRLQPEDSDGYIEVRYDPDALRVLEFDGQEYRTLHEDVFAEDPDEDPQTDR